MWRANTVHSRLMRDSSRRNAIESRPGYYALAVMEYIEAEAPFPLRICSSSPRSDAALRGGPFASIAGLESYVGV